MNMSVQASYNISSVTKATQIMKDEVEGRTEDKVGRYKSSMLVYFSGHEIWSYALSQGHQTRKVQI